MTTSDIKAIADRVLQARLSALGLDHIEVSIDRDNSGDSTLLVEAIMKPGVSAVGGATVSAAHGELNQSLLSAGEERFPYFRVRYPADETDFGSEAGNG